MREHLETPTVDLPTYRNTGRLLSQLLTDRIYHLDLAVMHTITKLQAEQNPKLKAFYDWLIESYCREQDSLRQQRL